MEDSSKYPDKYIKAFRDDYYRHGKFNLEVQAPHLAGLADHYKRKYCKTHDWRDCLKAHTLYNAVGIRKADNESWIMKAFEMQQLYWGENSEITFQQQQLLTDGLLADLENIRQKCRKEMLEADKLAKMYEDESVEEVVDTKFYECVKTISNKYSEMMLCFAERVIEECVKILSQKPPCEFQAVAIGSLAKGEATPYSDLEFLFLIERTTTNKEYFEMLAITSYFVIGNLRETKLSYMAIDELQGWFDDHAKNGFKIDGLSTGAGNIPTGNGLNQVKNHFIITPDELATTYEKVLNNPTKEALRGDLTAMLTYTQPFYSTPHGGKLAEVLRAKIKTIHPNDSRREVNRKMLRTDAEKFSFEPNAEFFNEGFNANVKKELYRFPSIILTDVSFILGHTKKSSWETLDLFTQQKSLAQYMLSALRFSLAAAVYVRLSAYLYHDSHDDRISVIQLPNEHQPREGNHAGRRWFLSQGMFSALFNKLLPFKFHLSKKLYGHISSEEPGTIVIMWSKVKTHTYSGRDDEALRTLVEIGCGDPVNAINNIPHVEPVSKYAFLTAEVLTHSGEEGMVLKLFQYLTEKTPSAIDESIKGVAANALCLLGRYNEALTTLQSVTENYQALIIQGICNAALRSYSKAEEKFLSALQILCNQSSTENITDYYGNYLASVSGPQQQQKCINIFKLTPEQRLHVINSLTPSSKVTLIVQQLASMYYGQDRLNIALSYCSNMIEFTDRTVPSSVTARLLMGRILTKMRYYVKAEEHYTKTLNIIYLMTNLSEQAVVVLEDISKLYLTQNKYLEAEKFCIKSLAKWTKSKNKLVLKNLCFPILTLRSQLGKCYSQMDRRHQYQAEELLCGVLNNLQILTNFDEKLVCRLNTTFFLSIFYMRNGKFSKAKELSTKWLKFYTQYHHTRSDEERVTEDIQSVKPGPICDIVGASDRFNFNY